MEFFCENVDCMERSMLVMLTLDLGYYCLPYIEICSNLYTCPVIPAKLFLNRVPAAGPHGSECLYLQFECLLRLLEIGYMIANAQLSCLLCQYFEDCC